MWVQGHEFFHGAHTRFHHSSRPLFLIKRGPKSPKPQKQPFLKQKLLHPVGGYPSQPLQDHPKKKSACKIRDAPFSKANLIKAFFLLQKMALNLCGAHPVSLEVVGAPKGKTHMHAQVSKRGASQKSRGCNVGALGGAWG